MQDRFERKISYLRLSVTDLCNLRCRYCMPEEGIPKRPHDEILTFEELTEIVGAAVELGVTKVRITGGEPLVRRGITDLCADLRAIPGLKELAVTTNGVLLPELAKPLKEAGVDRVNISLDTLDPVKYRELTRCGELQQVLDGIEAAREAGLAPIKLNAVLMGGFNDDEIEDLVELTRTRDLQMRFIELMPVGPGASFAPEAFIPCTEVLARVPELVPEGHAGVSRQYRLPGGAGTVGLITPISHEFCSECNRIRVTSDGKLKPCLHSAEEIPLRGLHGEALREAIRRGVLHKPASHDILQPGVRTAGERTMNAIGG